MLSRTTTSPSCLALEVPDRTALLLLGCPRRGLLSMGRPWALAHASATRVMTIIVAVLDRSRGIFPRGAEKVVMSIEAIAELLTMQASSATRSIAVIADCDARRWRARCRPARLRRWSSLAPELAVAVALYEKAVKRSKK